MVVTKLNAIDEVRLSEKMELDFNPPSLPLPLLAPTPRPGRFQPARVFPATQKRGWYSGVL